ncbi:hypothetical protein CRX72_24585 [Pantoea sp. BRM17]|nr:hypothetical protein CRX72_24585 [Pantoea sp. BRM17]
MNNPQLMAEQKDRFPQTTLFNVNEAFGGWEQVMKTHFVSGGPGGRGATTTFAERGLGDVLISFESEVNNIRNQYGKDDYEVIVPRNNILAEFPVAWVDKNVAHNNTAYPKQIHDWADLARDNVKLIFPNPKTSGNGRYTYLAAWGAAEKADGQDRAKTEAYMQKFLKNVEVFD